MYTPFGALILETEVGAEKMEKISLTQRSGFEVIHNSVNWRIAVHAYEEAVNGITAFTPPVGKGIRICCSEKGVSQYYPCAGQSGSDYGESGYVQFRKKTCGP